MAETAAIPEKIPDILVYEEIDGQPIYYRGFREVLAQKKTAEAITGCSDVQGLIISVLLEFLYQEIDKDQYRIMTNEIGLHVRKGNNLSSDIAIYRKSDLRKTPLKNQYFDIPPIAVIEVDTKADTANFNTPVDYYHAKTEKLFTFGVEQVFWFFSQNRKVMSTLPQQDWITKDWNKPVTLLGEYTFSAADLLKAEDIELPA